MNFENLKLNHPLDVANKYNKRRKVLASPREKLLLSTKNTAREKGLEHNIDLTDIQIPSFCPVFGIPITTDGNRRTGASVDRINPSKGYIKGNQKKEEVFKLLKRVTTPTTIYKKQKLDRDDVVDIKDFNVVSFVKSEMRVMLNEELARAILVGDGRPSVGDDDKINEENIRPIWTDADLYSHHVFLETDPLVNKTV